MESVPCLLGYQLILRLYQDLVTVINMKQSDLELTNMAQYLGMLVDTI